MCQPLSMGLLRMINWVKQFYERQNDLVGVYEGDIQDYHHEKVKLIKQAHPTAKTVLELGAGGGQMAVATSQAGYHVTAIELVSTLADHITQLAQQHQQSITVLKADFYTVELDKQFDLITYWDGFGIGSDNDQQSLLKRCAEWLKPDGVMLLDVYTPWYWAQAHGREMRFGDVHRRYEFDPEGCRMLDTWWHSDTPNDRATQSLRCYSPADLQLLIADTGLPVVDIVDTGGAVDAGGNYEAHVELHRAMSYTARLSHAS